MKNHCAAPSLSPPPSSLQPPHPPSSLYDFAIFVERIEFVPRLCWSLHRFPRVRPFIPKAHPLSLSLSLKGDFFPTTQTARRMVGGKTQREQGHGRERRGGEGDYRAAR